MNTEPQLIAYDPETDSVGVEPVRLDYPSGSLADQTRLRPISADGLRVDEVETVTMGSVAGLLAQFPGTFDLTYEADAISDEAARLGLITTGVGVEPAA